jgi:hypothetical protein
MLDLLVFCFMASAVIALHLPLDGRRWLATGLLAVCAALAFVAAVHAASDGRHWLDGDPAGRYQTSLDLAYLFALAVLAALAAPRLGQRAAAHRWLLPAITASVAAPLCYGLAAPLRFAVRTEHWWQKIAILSIADGLTALALLYWCLWLATRGRPLPGRLLAIALMASGVAVAGTPVAHWNALLLVAAGFWCAGVLAAGRDMLRLAR